MSSAAGIGPAAGVAAAVVVLAAPYLAGLTRTVPDRDVRRWWVVTRTSRGRLVATAVVGTVLGVFAGLAAGWDATLPAFVALALVATPLVVIDVEHHRLPDRLTATLAAAALVLFTIAAGVDGTWGAYGRAAVAAAVEGAVLLALRVASRGGFGAGDVKLGAVLGAYTGWFGWPFVAWGVFAGFVLGAFASLLLVLARRATMKTQVPFGPALLVGTLLAVLLGRW